MSCRRLTKLSTLAVDQSAVDVEENEFQEPCPFGSDPACLDGNGKTPKVIAMPMTHDLQRPVGWDQAASSAKPANQDAGLVRSGLLPPDSRRQTRTKRLITAMTSAPDSSHDGTVSRKGPAAKIERTKEMRALQANIAAVLYVWRGNYHSLDERNMTNLRPR
jgi:hypothetical protein